MAEKLGETEEGKEWYYKSQGLIEKLIKHYWRGSIWAPLTYLVIDGLRNGGEYTLSREII